MQKLLFFKTTIINLSWLFHCPWKIQRILFSKALLFKCFMKLKLLIDNHLQNLA